MSWFWRGFQSAVFYYVSCAPCNELAHRRRRRKGAARSRTEQEMEQGLFPHPSPFSTNIYWREEITLGPGPPQKKRDRDKERQQRARDRIANNECRRDLVTGSSGDTGTSSADTMVASSSVHRVTELEQERRSGDNWNRRRYQREDEILWGIDSTSEAEDSYCTARNPAVNDLHPPVVSTQPTHPSETRWMLQPPPSAKVMEGKERATRSRSGSGDSNGSSRRGEIRLGKQIGERMVEKKRRNGQTPEPTTTGSAAMSRAASIETSSSVSTRGQRHDRDATASPSKIKSPPINIIPDPKSPPRVPIPTAAENSGPQHRPPLQTIISSTVVPPVHSPSKTSKPQYLSSRPPLMQTTSASSLRALQELISPSAALNSRPLSVPDPPALPDPDGNEDQELEIPKVKSLWPQPAVGEDGGWGLNGRERRERWSMDV
ncbi:MAG: hypothetical protein LQ343_002082 [Gyalolechia ehrenbergii]|nr:MAG: hypothetical protein LQ343_002082 [Gyalolechia ehrenbergii]